MRVCFGSKGSLIAMAVEKYRHALCSGQVSAITDYNMELQVK